MDPTPENDRRDQSRIGTEPLYASPFTITGRIRSLRHAMMGLWFVMRSQHNAWLHAVATVLAFVLAIVLEVTVADFTASQWCALVVAVMLVWVAEAFNTCLEVLADVAMSHRHPAVKIAKDVAAGAVLMAAIGAVVVGCIVLLPPLVELVGRLFKSP